MIEHAKLWLNVAAHPLRAAFVLGLLHALAMTMAFPPFGFWLTALVALWPLIHLALHAPRESLGKCALLAALGALPFWMWTHQYVLGSSALGFYPMVLNLTIYPAIFVWLLGRALRRFPRSPLWAAVPVIWIGLEYIRGEIIWDGYAWYLISQPLIDWDAARRFAPIVGMYGVGAWIALVSGWLFDLHRWWTDPSTHKLGTRGLRPVGISIGIGLLMGAVLPGPQAAPDGNSVLRVAIIQTNVPQSIKDAWPIDQRIADFERFTDLALSASTLTSEDGRTVELIIWPETSFPGFWLNEDAVAAEREANLSFGTGIPTTYFRDRLLELQKHLGVPMIIGAVAAEGVRIQLDETGRPDISSDREFNSAFLIQHGQVQPHRYDKMHLTPFGEVMPYISRWKWLEQKLLALGADGMTFGLSAGTNPAPLAIALTPERELRVATPICFEASVSNVCRNMAVDSSGQYSTNLAHIFAALTNDGWFHWQSSGRLMHLILARWRCAELGIPMARAANTGVSALIDAEGRIIASTLSGPTASAGKSLHAEGYIVGDLPLVGERPSPFGSRGDIVGEISALALLIYAIFTLAPSRKPTMSEQIPPPPTPDATPPAA